MLTESEFRNRYPAFANAASDSVILYLDLAYDQFNAKRIPPNWQDYLAGLFVAHNLTLDGSGSTAGEVQGPASSQTVDKVSVSYDTQAVTDANAGFWNATTYGQRFYYRMRLFGAGPVQVMGTTGGVGQVL